MKYFLLLLLIILTSSCSQMMRSGQYVKKNGKWVFVESRGGIMNFFKNPVRESVESYADIPEGKFLWPVPHSKRISSFYGSRGRRHHDGIDIPAPRGTDIVASEDGEVIFSGNMKGYGKLIVIKHDDGYHTVYAHNSKNSVSKGEEVKRGEAIAEVGNTGRSSGPHLHFEIRKNNKVRDPAYYLPLVKRVQLAKNSR
jgi:murein DD-endopeptidase MepM/ murein hydrolase activator NlpD